MFQIHKRLADKYSLQILKIKILTRLKTNTATMSIRVKKIGIKKLLWQSGLAILQKKSFLSHLIILIIRLPHLIKYLLSELFLLCSYGKFSLTPSKLVKCVR